MSTNCSLVNDEVITSYDIIQRLKLTAIIQGINLKAQNSTVLNIADELIEKVKLSKINEYQIKVEDEIKKFEINFLKEIKLIKMNY